MSARSCFSDLQGLASQSQSPPAFTTFVNSHARIFSSEVLHHQNITEKCSLKNAHKTNDKPVGMATQQNTIACAQCHHQQAPRYTSKAIFIRRWSQSCPPRLTSPSIFLTVTLSMSKAVLFKRTQSNVPPPRSKTNILRAPPWSEPCFNLSSST